MEEIQEKDTLTEPVSDNSSDVSQQQEDPAPYMPSAMHFPHRWWYCSA